MNDRRQTLIDVFQDTKRYYTENQALADAVEHSKARTAFYKANNYPPLPQKREAAAVVEVTKSKTFETAMKWQAEHPEDWIAVLNFASAVNPGGGVAHGSSAQEESLCRCSTLYPTLNQSFLWRAYYNWNRAEKNVLHTDDCIYSPGIVICKTDESVPRRMEPEQWVTVDVISCAAPNLRQDPYNIHNPEGGRPVFLPTEELVKLHTKRAKHILHIAAANSVDVLILGAFGCGAFENDPLAVATAYNLAIPEYRHYFKRIEFAVYCRKFETKNYDAFKQIIGREDDK